jgi:hypothetical protein
MASAFSVATKDFIRSISCPEHGLPPGVPCPSGAGTPRLDGSSCQMRLMTAQAIMNGGRWPKPARRLAGPVRSRFAAAVDQGIALGCLRGDGLGDSEPAAPLAERGDDDDSPPWDIDGLPDG